MPERGSYVASRGSEDPRLVAVAAQLGLEAFSAEQRQALYAVLEGRDVLAVIGTGRGKSAIYQAAGALLDGPTVVVSPLLALQRDQAHHLAASELDAAVRIDGATNTSDRRARLGRLREGSAEYLFVTPETLFAADILEELATTAPSLFVVDEAHCIVSWGRGFRQDYALLGDARQALGGPLTIALTASADPRVRADITRSLSLRNAEEIVADLERANIALRHSADDDEAHLVDQLVATVADQRGKVIVYVPRRRDCEDLAARLTTPRRPAMPFHAGMHETDKAGVLDTVRSRACVVVATTAFGMGVDIPDISAVFHLEMPESLIAYYQEVGRAGRNGSPAIGHAFTRSSGPSRRAFAAGVHDVSVTDCLAVHLVLARGATSRRELMSAAGLGAGTVVGALGVLEAARAVTTKPRVRVLRPPDPDLVEALCAERAEFDRSQAFAVEAYRNGRTCRWAQLLAALGQAIGPCGRCDVCDDRTPDELKPAERTGRRCHHDEFGPGTITSIDDDVVTVSFDRVGPKCLAASFCFADGGLSLQSDSAGVVLPTRSSPEPGAVLGEDPICRPRRQPSG